MMHIGAVPPEAEPRFFFFKHPDLMFASFEALQYLPATVGQQVVEMRNVLDGMEEQLSRLKLADPPMQSDFQMYWDSLSKWILEILPSFIGGMQ
jgi:hypothetical protein